MAECSGNLSGLKAEKCSNRLIHAVTEFEDITLQYNIGLGYARMFSRQSFKPAVALKVGKVFYRFSCTRNWSIRARQEGDLFNAELFQKKKKKNPRSTFLAWQLMQQKYSANWQLEMPSCRKWEITSVWTLRSITALSVVPGFLKWCDLCR